ncbi:hypothetical protein SAMN04489844_1798 [Nocardioides exalbidus]|uniref:Uncharacterized protein n=1 Tax=Nocardioides exalbidus TaxID=402596 RepID=A0A1H4Q9F5_9ACTN|nr:hypothetical protein [Nocardioides exalbidus]SEC16264.1 hypothetical protein SAMN04489844_1798 [Nocardioides exalbidus]
MDRPDVTTLRRRLEPGRLLLGSLLEIGIKAYGAGAALSVALSDTDTVGGKAGDAVRAVPNLSEKYHRAQYLVDHRQEIESAVTYLNEHTVSQAELEGTITRSSATLDSIETTYSEVDQAREVLQIDGIRGTIDNARKAIGHIGNAWSAKPDLDSINQLAVVADQVRPLLDQVDVLIPVYYGSMLALTDNFASDEIAGTLVVMALAFGIAAVLGRVVGFWVRRGRPGLLAVLLQALGARVFRPWYVANLPWAMSPPLYDAAREGIQRRIVADPEAALDEESFRELEQYFARRADPGS